MKKLIGVSLIALFAITADAQVYPGSGYTTIVKDKGDGKRKVKVVPNPPQRTIIYTTSPRVIEMYHEGPYYGYRKAKYYDNRGVPHKVIITDDRYRSRYYHYYYYR